MRLTERDVRLVRDLALSHVLSRDHLLSLGYFSSVTRANTRLRDLREAGLVQRLATPFFSQNLYAVGPKALPLLGVRIVPIVSARSGSPRFLQHALCTTNVRVAFLAKGATAWRFEQQSHATFRFAGRDYQVRPDGIAVWPGHVVAIEVDLGHVAPSKFKEKLRAYDAFAASGECQRKWKASTVDVLTVTTGKLRASRLMKLTPANARLALRCVPFEELGIPFVGAWS